MDGWMGLREMIEYKYSMMDGKIVEDTNARLKPGMYVSISNDNN